MNGRILRMETRHIDALALVEKECFSTPWSRESIANELHSLTAYFLVAEEPEGRVMGYVGSQRVFGEWYISNVAVLHEYRHKGVARALLHEIISEARKSRGSFISLEVRPSNKTAIALYQSLGFAEAGRRRGFYNDPTEDGLILTLQLQTEEKKEAAHEDTGH